MSVASPCILGPNMYQHEQTDLQRYAGSYQNVFKILLHELLVDIYVHKFSHGKDYILKFRTETSFMKHKFLKLRPLELFTVFELLQHLM